MTYIKNKHANKEANLRLPWLLTLLAVRLVLSPLQVSDHQPISGAKKITVLRQKENARSFSSL